MQRECQVKIHLLKRMLNNKKASWGKKLLALIGLTQIASDEAIAILQRYHFDPDPQMRAYAKLAFEEAKYFGKNR